MDYDPCTIAFIYICISIIPNIVVYASHIFHFSCECSKSKINPASEKFVGKTIYINLCAGINGHRKIWWKTYANIKLYGKWYLMFRIVTVMRWYKNSPSQVIVGSLANPIDTVIINTASDYCLHKIQTGLLIGAHDLYVCMHKILNHWYPMRHMSMQKLYQSQSQIDLLHI